MKLQDAKVLVVEDSPGMQAYVVHLLKLLQVQSIEVSSDGGHALRMLDRFSADVILSDIHMLPVNGLDFVRELRRSPNPARQNTPVIYLSADTHGDMLFSAMSLGSVAYIVKPPRPEVLRAKLEDALN